MSPFPADDLVPIAADHPEVADLADLAEWRFGADGLRARFALPSYAAGLEAVARIGAEAERAQHHPDLTLTYGALEVTTSSHDVGAVTRRDLRLARAVSTIMGALGATVRADD